MNSVTDILDAMKAAVSALARAGTDRAIQVSHVRDLTARLMAAVDQSTIVDVAAIVLDVAPSLIDLGLLDEARAQLAMLLAAAPCETVEAIRARTIQARLAATDSHFVDAVDVLEDALIDASRTESPLRRTVTANLAAAYLRAGNMPSAQKWVEVAGRGDSTADLAAEVLISSVRTSLERHRSSGRLFVQAAEAQQLAINRYLDGNPSCEGYALAALGTAASTEFELARLERAADRAERAVDLLDVVLQRTSASLGADHPQSLALQCAIATAEFELASGDGSPEAIRRAIPALRTAAGRTAELLGSTHRLSLNALSNVAMAEFELARAERSTWRGQQAVELLRQASDSMASVLGRDHLAALAALSNLATAEFELAKSAHSPKRVLYAVDILSSAFTRSLDLLGGTHPATLILEQQIHDCRALLSDESIGFPADIAGASFSAATYETYEDQYLPFGEIVQALSDSAQSEIWLRDGVADFDGFYLKNYTRLLKFVQVIGPSLDGETIAADVLTRAWLNWSEVGTSSSRAWVFRTAADLVRTLRTKKGSIGTAARWAPLTTDPRQAVQLHNLMDALANLPDAQRDAIALACAGISREEIAAALDCTELVVARNISRGRDAIRDQMTGRLLQSSRNERGLTSRPARAPYDVASKFGGIYGLAIDVNDMELAPDAARRQVDRRDDPVDRSLQSLAGAMSHETDVDRVRAVAILGRILVENRRSKTGSVRKTSSPASSHLQKSSRDMTEPYVSSVHQPAPTRAEGWEPRYRRSVVVSDVFSALIAVIAAGLLVSAQSGALEAQTVGLGAITLIIVLASLGMNRAWNLAVLGQGSEEFGRLARGLFSSFVVLTTLALAVGAAGLRPWAFVVVPVTTLTAFPLRYFLRRFLHRARGDGRCLLPVLAAGSPHTLRDLIERTRINSHIGWRVDAVCTADGLGNAAGELDGIPVVGRLDELADHVRRRGYRIVAITADPYWTPKRLQQLAWKLEGTGADLVVAPTLMEVAGPRLHVSGVLGMPLLRVSAPAFTGGRRVIKNIMDVFGAAIALIALSPLFVAASLTIVLESRGPVFYRQRRVGKDGKEFTIVKFRTMIRDADQRLADLAEQNEGAGLLFKMRRDPRVTRVGAVLRRYSIDDLPQLLNVLSGSMSLVGPRPPLPEETAKYGPDVRRRLLVKPGITGLWQVSGRSDLSWDEAVRLDLRYVEDWSIALDLVILWKTVRAVLSGQGAY